MSNPRMLLGLGLLANILFWASVFGFAAMRPEYSHFTDATSELGSWDAPRMWWFNTLGYIIPGALLAVCGLGLTRAAAPGLVLAIFLALPGIGLAMSGVFPADMADRQGVWTILHAVGALLGLAWVPGLLIVAWRVRKDRPALSLLSLLWIALEIAAFALYGLLLSAPSLVQRLTFAVWLSWFPFAAVTLFRRAPAA